MDEQRRAPRRPADWAARYRLDAAAEWRDCRLIDVSWEGAAIELHGVDDDEPLVGVLDLEITSVTGRHHGMPVRGDVRHRSRTAMGRVLVGIEFQSLTSEQLRLLEILVRMGAAVERAPRAGS
jgi:PilZ domain